MASSSGVGRAILAACALLAAGPAVHAQPAAGAGPSPSLRVLLAPFRETGSDGRLPGLALFTQRLIQMELLGNPAVRVIETDLPVPCSRPPSFSLRDAAADTLPPPPEGGPFYLLDGSVDPSGAEFLLEVELVRCDSAGSTRLFHENFAVSWENAVVELVSISERISDILRQEAPSARVVLPELRLRGGASARGLEIGRRLWQRLQEAIVETGDFDVVGPGDTAGPTGDLMLRGELVLGPDSALAAGFDLSGGAVARQLRVAGGTADLEAFFARVLEEVIPAIYRVRYAEHAGDTATVPRVRQAVTGAQVALCLAASGSGCTPRPEDALVILLTVAPGDSSDIVTWTSRYVLLGRAYLQLRRGPEAVESLTRALELAERTAGGAAALDQSPDGVPLLNLLAEAYRAIGSFEASAEFSARSLRVNPVQPSVVRLYADALRFSGRRLDAVAAVAEARRTDPRNDVLPRLMIDLVAELKPSDLPGAAPVLTAVCDAAVRRRCTERLLALGESFYQTGSWPASAAAFRIALQLGVGRERRVEILAYAAAASLGALRSVVDEDGRRSEQPIAFQPDSAAHYLALAEAEADRRGAPPVLREWLARLRSHYWRASGDYQRAFEYAELADRINPNPESRLLRAQLLLMNAQGADDFQSPDPPPEARELYRRAAREFTALTRMGLPLAYGYLRESNHRLGQDRSTRAELERLLRADPGDVVARHTLQFVCAEYLHDFPCAYELALAAYRGGDLREAADFVELAELAVLVGEHAVAGQALDVSLRMGGDPCVLAVTWFYRFWNAAASGTEPELGPAFSAWVSVLDQQRREGGERCWIFRGAASHLTVHGAPHARLLLDMIDAMRDPRAPIPDAPR